MQKDAQGIQGIYVRDYVGDAVKNAITVYHQALLPTKANALATETWRTKRNNPSALKLLEFGSTPLIYALISSLLIINL